MSPGKILLAIFLLPGTVWTWLDYMFPGRGRVWASGRRWKSPTVKALYSLIIWGILIVCISHKSNHTDTPATVESYQQSIPENSVLPPIHPEDESAYEAAQDAKGNALEGQAANEEQAAEKEEEKHEYPGQLVNVIASSDWPFVRAALVVSGNIGTDPVKWSNKHDHHAGMVVLTGAMADSNGCRQFRVTRTISESSSDDAPLSALVDLCTDGTVH